MQLRLSVLSPDRTCFQPVHVRPAGNHAVVDLFRIDDDGRPRGPVLVVCVNCGVTWPEGSEGGADPCVRSG